MRRFVPVIVPVVLLLLISLFSIVRWIAHTQQVLAAGGPTMAASISADSQQGTNGWYTSGVTVTMTASGSTGIKAITYWLDSGSPLTVNASQTVQTFSANGRHVLSFYATDVNNVQGPTGTLSFNIDTVSPVNWANIVATRQGNDHTYSFQITVSDPTSGLDPTKVYSQYSTDYGLTYGYFSNFGKCNSTWVPSQWYNLTGQTFSSGANTATITTPAIDFCNSVGSQCYVVKFRILDLAGNTSDKRICLDGPWIQTQNADVFSVSNISMNADGAQPNATYVVGTGGQTISGFTSANNLYLRNYPGASNISVIDYASLNAKYGSTAMNLPSGKLPTTTGVYKVNGDLTISSTLLPANYATTPNFATIILVPGTVTINTNITTMASSTLVIVAGGAINIDQAVANLSGVYVSSGQFDTSYNANSNVQLQVKGMVLSEAGFTFARNLGNATNATTPAEIFTYQPQYLLNTNLQKLLTGSLQYDWREVSP